MGITEIYCKVYVMENLTKEEVTIELNKLIDTAIMQTEEMQPLHISREYKFYCFSGLKPIEFDGVYKKGNIYTFVLRTVDEKLAQYFKATLAQQYTKSLKALTVEVKVVRRKLIEKIYTLTPVILKFDTGYWRSKCSEETFEKRIRENMIKKYNTFNNIELDEDFELFNHIKFDNQKPVAFHYKDVTLLGDKVTLEIATNDSAQQLAYLAIGSGLGEMNARGAGFINFKYL